MLRSFALLLLLVAFVAPAAVSAKAVIERPSKEIFEEEIITEEEPLEETSQEVTEVVTEEIAELDPIFDEPKRDECDELNDLFGLRKKNNFESEWAVFYRLSGFSPKGNSPGGGSIMNNFGLRYKVPDKWGEYFQLAYELSYNFWDGSNSDIEILEFAVEVFACSSPLFRMKHHPYYGIGFGNAEVSQNTAPTFNQNTWSVFGGIEFPGRRLDYDVFAKYVYGPDGRYDMDDLQLGLGVVYTFGRGR